ncbi:MAG: hypothetical protein DMG57_19600 [Acidobacteria bacterium]|nr:MAG: hypothetical protein DMG57_19600 [Acidobacteriota bacterium]
MRNPVELAMIGINEASGAFLGPASYGVTTAENAFRGECIYFEENAFKDKGAGRALATSYLAKDPDPYALTLLEWPFRTTVPWCAPRLPKSWVNGATRAPSTNWPRC